MCILKSYRTEQLTRLEALRVMYAGSLIEEANLKKNNNISDAQRYRIVTEIIKAINPSASSVTVNAAYLDTIWRSPQAIWTTLIDSCRVRGVFSTALSLPPLDATMRLAGGYYTDDLHNWEETRIKTVGKAFQLVQILK